MNNEQCNIKVHFNSTIVELKCNKDYEEKIQTEFKRFCTIEKTNIFKDFLNFFMIDKEEKEKEKIDLKVMRMVSI